MHKGQRFRRNFDSEAEARLWEAEARAALMAGRKPEMGDSAIRDMDRPRTLGELLAVVQRDHWAHCKAPEVAALNARTCLGILGDHTLIEKVRLEHVDKIVERLRAQGLSNATINRKVSALSKMLNFAFEREWRSSASPRFRRLKESEHRIRYLDESEEGEMINFFRRIGNDDMADFVAVDLDTGLRVGEMLRLTGRDVDAVLSVWMSKSGKPRSVPLTTRARTILERRKDRLARTSDLLFPGMTNFTVSHYWRRMRDHLDLLDDAQFVPHAMRHTFGSRLAMRGVDARRIMELMGHCNLVVTQRYMHLSRSSLEAAISALDKPYGEVSCARHTSQDVTNGGENHTVA
jgi:site-specific recombinase XerD